MHAHLPSIHTSAHIHNVHVHIITVPTPHQTTYFSQYNQCVSVSVTGMSVLHKTNRTCGWLLNDNVHFGNNKQRVNRSPVLECVHVHSFTFIYICVSVSLKQKFDTILKNYWCNVYESNEMVNCNNIV